MVFYPLKTSVCVCALLEKIRFVLNNFTNYQNIRTLLVKWKVQIDDILMRY